MPNVNAPPPGQTPYPTPVPGTEPCPTPREPDCKGYFGGQIHGHISLDCKCACPQYKDHFVVLNPTTPQASVYTDIGTWIAANPGAKFGSITDLEHAGWLLHVHLPV